MPRLGRMKRPFTHTKSHIMLELTDKELAVLEYLYDNCRTPDKYGGISVDRQWDRSNDDAVVKLARVMKEQGIATCQDFWTHVTNLQGHNLAHLENDGRTAYIFPEGQQEVRRRRRTSPSLDAFLSHNPADKPVVEEVAKHLIARGVNVWLDKWHLIPGEPWQEAIEQALNASKTCIIFIGQGGVGPWQHEEMRAAVDRRVKERVDFRVIPVFLPGAPKDNQLPSFLLASTSVRFEKADDEQALAQLIAGIQGHPPGLDVSPDDTSAEHPRIFLCHAHEDKPRVEELYFALGNEGFDPWYDKEKLTIGDDFEQEIIAAIEKSDFFAICLSQKAVTKTGFINKEIRTAIREYQKRPHGVAFVLPIRLEECELPSIKLDDNKTLASLHWLDLFAGDEDAMKRLANQIWTQWRKRHARGQ